MGTKERDFPLIRTPAENSDPSVMHVKGALIDDYGQFTRVIPNTGNTRAQQERLKRFVEGGTITEA